MSKNTLKKTNELCFVLTNDRSQLLVPLLAALVLA